MQKRRVKKIGLPIKEKERSMKYEIDVSWLRRAMEDYYGTAMFNGFPTTVLEMSEVERMSDQEVVDLAQKIGMDLEKYTI